MLGCARREAILASVVNFSRSSISLGTSARMSLMATVRTKPSSPSRTARYTSAMPPSPSLRIKR